MAIGTISNASEATVSGESQKLAEEFQKNREYIDMVDEKIVALLGARSKFTAKVGEIKKVLNLPVYDPEREKYLAKLHQEWAKEYEADSELVTSIFKVIIEHSKKKQRQSR